MTYRTSELIIPKFHEAHRAIREHQYTHYRFKGGRGSAKSSVISLEIILLIKRHPLVHALVTRNYASNLKNSVFAQMRWAITTMGLDNEFKCTVSPMEITYIPTGQKILFRGVRDDPTKIKSIKLPFGYIGITWFEELDQIGPEDERIVLQSTMRGGEKFWNFESYNPPATQANWVNEDSLTVRPDRLITEACYLDVPPQWLGEQFFIEADELNKINPRAYRHEYLGEITGTGTSVFENVRTETITDEQIAQFDRILHGVDWGYYPDPWAYNRMYFDKPRRVLYIFGELEAYRQSNQATYQMLLDAGVTTSDDIICDSAEPKSIADYRQWDLRARTAEKGPGSVEYSMKWLQGLTAIIIDPVRCPKTAREFLRYEYERAKKDGEVISGYPDKNNHHIDAVRYGTNDIWRRRGN